MGNSSWVSSRKETWLLWSLLVLAAFTYRRLITGMDVATFLPSVVGSFFSYSGTSPQFLYVLVIGLLLVRRKEIRQAYHEAGSPWNSLFYLLPAGLLFLWGQYVDVTDILHLSLILACLGVAHFLSGRRLVLAILPPVLILLLATPIPAVVLNQILFQFQLWDAQHSAWVLNAIGLPSVPVGDMIYMAGHSVRVAESCTALGFLKWLTIFALAYVYIFPMPRVHAVILVLSAPLIAYMVNLLRVFSLVLNPKMEVLSIHTAQGVAFFMIGFALLYALDSLLLRVFNDQSVSEKASGNASEKRVKYDQKRRPLLALMSLFATLFVVSLVLPQWSFPAGNMHRLHLSLADELGDWRLQESPPIPYRFLGSVRYSSSILRNYLREKNEPVQLFIGYDDRLQPQQSMVSEKNAFPGERGRLEERYIVALGKPWQQAVAILAGDDRTRFLIYYWYQGVASLGKEFLYALLALDQSPFRRSEPALVVRLSTTVEPGPEGLKLADRRLRDFLEDLNHAEQLSTRLKKKGPNIHFGPSLTGYLPR